MLARGFKTKCENMSLGFRKELGLKKTDPMSPALLADHLSVKLYTPNDIKGLSPAFCQILLGKGKDAWSAITLSLDGTDVLIYNPTHSKARQASDMMHELSHIIIGHEAGKIIMSTDSKYSLRSYKQDQEDEANWLAGCLLLPREATAFIKRAGLDDDEACDRYGVSQALLDFRIKVTGVNYQYR